MPEARAIGSLIAERRKARGWNQAELAIRLHMKRETLSQIERGLSKYPLQPETVNRLAGLLEVSVLELVRAQGYDVRFAGIEDEAGAALLEAFLEAPPDRRLIAQLALGLGPELSGGGFLESLRRLAARDHQDRQGTQE